MTGTASNRGKLFSDFDSYKNDEWLRRRKLRLEQVRRQSSDIARALRQKVSCEERTKAEESQRLREAELRCWKAEKLMELETKLRSALDDFGTGHKLAQTEPDPEEVLEERSKVNYLKAQERGEIAKQQELKKKKMEQKKKLSPIQRKKMTRKLEDLRSALVRSVAAQKLIEEKFEEKVNKKEEEGEEEKERRKDGISGMKEIAKTPKRQEVRSVAQTRKVGGKKGKSKKISRTSSDFVRMCECRNKGLGERQPNEVETVWINLNDVQSASAVDTGSKRGSFRSGMTSSRLQREKGIVFYDYPSRYYSRAFKEFPNLVEKIEPDAMPNATELAIIEEEEKEKKYSEKKKQEDERKSQERGAEALRKEKINRDYNNLIAKLDELYKKEKILKSQKRVPTNVLYMTDERLSERAKTIQRKMDSEFEKIFYEATAGMPSPELHKFGGGDYVNPDERPSTKLSFSPARLKTNTPVTPTPSPPVHRPKTRRKTKKKLLSDIEKALMEGRTLRETVSRNWEKSEEVVENKEVLQLPDAKSQTEEKEVQVSEIQEPVKSQDRESQTENIKIEENVDVVQGNIDYGCGDGGGDDSLPMSSTTSYKSLPNEISCRLRQFLDYFEGASEEEEEEEDQQQQPQEHNPRFKKKIKKILEDLLVDKTEYSRKDEGPTLEYYILRLLSMTRESVADLSVSSENISTPNITDLDLKVRGGGGGEGEEEEDGEKEVLKGENLVRSCTLRRAESLEESIRNWRSILSENLGENVAHSPEIENKIQKSEDEVDCSHRLETPPKNESPPPVETDDESEEGEKKSEEEPDVVVLYSPKTKNRYDTITQKCSERICKLSTMLDQVRKDKEKLLHSTSGASSLTLSRDSKKSESFGEDVPVRERQSLCDRTEFKSSFQLDNFVDRYKLSHPKDDVSSSSTLTGSQSRRQNSNASFDSIPDVVDELLKRQVLTSPFKWSDGDRSPNLSNFYDSPRKPPSIESVIGNFRKEMSRIKPFALMSAGTPIQSDAKTTLSCCTDDNPREFRDEDSSVESINQALTSLGLNWAKSFLRKNEESRAMSSSSGSEDEKSPDRNPENFYY